jgi:hypothetical protein
MFGVVPSFFFTKTTGDDQGLADGVITSLFNIPFTCLSISFAKTSGSLQGGCFIGCADPVAMLFINDAYPLPRIDDSFDYLSGSSWFSTFDLCSGYWQVECEGSDRQKTAFATRSGDIPWYWP